ncbi:hypothetical protein V8E53_003636 [Lactarius tabidus]
MVSIYLLLIQFKIPAERSTFFVKAQTLSVNDASESEGYLTSRRLSKHTPQFAQTVAGAISYLKPTSSYEEQTCLKVIRQSHTGPNTLRNCDKAKASWHVTAEQRVLSMRRPTSRVNRAKDTAFRMFVFVDLNIPKICDANKIIRVNNEYHVGRVKRPGLAEDDVIMYWMAKLSKIYTSKKGTVKASLKSRAWDIARKVPLLLYKGP